MATINPALCKNDPILRLNTIAPYFTMFPLDFPMSCLKNAQKGDVVLDPFCGRGTTIFAARLLGLSAIGMDSSPLAYTISAAKLTTVEQADIVSRCESALHSTGTAGEIPEGEFWELCYHSQTLHDICVLREYFINTMPDPIDIALRAILVGILHGPVYKGYPGYLSNQMPRTYATKPKPAVKFWKQKGMVPPCIDVLDLVRRRSAYVFSRIPPSIEGAVHLHDSRQDMKGKVKKKAAWIVTSPPYWKMRSYWPDQWLRLWFLGGTPDVAYVHDGQVAHTGLDDFINDLATIWDNCAHVAQPGAHFIIRFGALPSALVDPEEILRRSFREAKSSFTGMRVFDAGVPSRGRRQAEQFIKNASQAQHEIDFHVRLEKCNVR